MEYRPLLAGAVLLAALSAGAHRPNPAQTNPYRDIIASGTSRMLKSASARKSTIPFLSRRAGEKKTLWKPGYAIRTDWNGMSWKDYARYTFSYDSEGRTLTETAENLDKTQSQYYTFSRIRYTYDEEGRLVRSEVTAGFSIDDMRPVSVTEITYDEICHDVVAEQNAYDIDASGNRTFNDDSYKQIIERNDDGNIVAMNAFTWYGDGFMEVLALETEYDADGAPVSLTESTLTQETEDGPLELKPSTSYTDCEWFDHDGQIISLDEITEGANRLKSAKINTSEQAGITMSVEYPGGAYDYISTSEYQYLGFIPTKTVMSYKDFGDGGYYSKSVMDQDLTVAGAYPVQAIDQILVKYDEYGNLLENQNQTFYGHTIINSWKKGVVTEDPATGFPLTYLRSTYHLNEGNDYYGVWEDDYKITYGEWHDAAGVGQVESDALQSEDAEYFDCFGRRISGEAGGLVIRRRGNTVDKIIR